MKKWLILIALLVVGALFVPAVSALEETFTEFGDSSAQSHVKTTDSRSPVSGEINRITITNIERYQKLNLIAFDSNGNLNVTEGDHPFSYSIAGGHVKNGNMHVTKSYNLLGIVTHTRIQCFFYDWDVTELIGTKNIDFAEPLFIGSGVWFAPQTSYSGDPYHATLVSKNFASSSYENMHGEYDVSIIGYLQWENTINIQEDGGMDNIILQRNNHPSTITIKNATSIVFTDYGIRDIQVYYQKSDYDSIIIKSSSGQDYTVTMEGSTSPSDVTKRTGTVTMTDNNGTTIRGFEATAVNHYTGAEYTVSTETDVAVMTLPMDRTIEIRNPQTGVYEEAPIGYYRFYGQAPGYKMLNEEGIQVSVMPEKYGSYQLCDIRVTQESGYLTGKHQFQIRSRSDNSILQTGTISAKSATTGEWYNTTVSGGLATLILPYDTSNVQSQYAGNYYVYATSPGYKDSDYGTQIVVMPHTVSEIHNILLTPIGGIPPAGNVTLRIQAFSETGTGIPNAEIFIAGVLGEGASVWNTYTASSTGYLTVSVPANSTYDIVASGAGYYDSARRVEVFTNDPPLIEIKLYLFGTPTAEPTTEPTGWVTTPPTQTTPTIQEDNLIGLSVKGLAKGFGIDYDTALLLFGLMIIFGAGGMVMSSVKGGAMEFIAGSIVGTFVAFALGLIPIWIFIIIAVVFGAYVLRVFVQGGQ